MANYAVIGSSNGSSFQAIYPEVKKLVNSRLNLVVSDQADAGLLHYGVKHSVAAVYMPHQKVKRNEYGLALANLMEQHNIDWIVLVGFMRILSADFVEGYRDRIVNLHPSLLPRHKGLMDLEVHQAVLDNNESETGCSLHKVTAAVDEGDVVLQMKCMVENSDTVLTLKQKVQKLEAECLKIFIEQKVI